MSPERIEHKAYSYSSDIWSLGLVLAECATGRYPFSGEASGSQIALVMCITEGDSPLPPEDGRFTPEFHRLLESMLEREPERRASAAELLQHPW